MKANYFNDCKTIESLKKEYRRLSKIYHPDNGSSGSEETMKEINSLYDDLFNTLRDVHNAKAENATKQNTECPEDFRNIINELLKLDNITVEICGSWLWIGGTGTFKNKEKLKSLGCKYASKKKLWYLGELQKKSRKTLSMDAIRTKYGSEVYTSERVLQLAY